MRKPSVLTRVSYIPILIDDVGCTAEPSNSGSLAGAISDMQNFKPTERHRLSALTRERIDREPAIKWSWGAHPELIGVHLKPAARK